MQIIQRNSIAEVTLPGRVIQKIVGKDACSKSTKMTMGFGHYGADIGKMEPHQHAEEICYIVDAVKAYVRYGPSKDNLTERASLEKGMTLHVPELEWHVFEYDADGYIDLIFFYGQVENIRPEEINKS
ncbi:MAG: hypothetical protein JSV25_13410 [Spirochaetota bacterium]|nr:MAG: hypothetical protein JSV25_13410 [Spirochaetota bacterium]